MNYLNWLFNDDYWSIIFQLAIGLLNDNNWTIQ